MDHAAVPLPDARLAILIVNYQTGDEIGALIDSLRAHPPNLPWHAVVIDNGSPDGSGEQLAQRYAAATDVTVWLTGRNLGFGQANNWAAKQLTAEYLAFLNPDCLVEADAFTAAVEYLERNPGIGVVGPRFYRSWGELEATVRTFPDLWAGLAGRQSKLRKLWPNNPLSKRYLVEDQAMDGAMVCDWVVGTVMVVRRGEFLRIGGFDPDFFLYWEDCDLCWRYLKRLQLKTAYLPVGHVVHLSEGASKKVRPFAIRHFNRAAYTLVRKHIYVSRLHPLRWFAWLALGLRTRLQLRKAVGESVAR